MLIIIWLAALAGSGSYALAASAQPAEVDSLTTPRSSYTTSAWGDIPAPADSVTAAFANRRRSTWEWPLYVPYAAINYPLRWVREGFGKGVAWADSRNLFRYLSLVPTPRGIVPSIAWSSQEGLGLGLNFYVPAGFPNSLARIRGMYSTKKWQKYTAGAIFNKDGRWSAQVGAGYKLMPNLEVYGVGPNTTADGLAYYKDERVWAGVIVRRRFFENQFVALTGTYSSIDARLPESGYYPTVPEKYGDNVPGFGETSNGILARLAWFYNTTAETGDPQRGTLAGVTVGGFAATNTNDVSFTAYRFELQQFFPLWFTGRALAFRGYFNFIDDTGNAQIPFQRMFINEIPDMFRAFDSGRWRDLGITGVDLEYRFPFIADKRKGGFGIDAALLTDIGQVFSERSELQIDNLTYSYGFGFRAFMNHFYIGNMEFVWGDEGFQFRLSTKQLFQYSRDVLFQGREETLIH